LLSRAAVVGRQGSTHFAVMSSFIAKKLDIAIPMAETSNMAAQPRSPSNTRRVSAVVRRRIEAGGERLWRFEDFRGLPFSAVAQALSRLAKAGYVERLSKGVYYRSRRTAFGKSRPNPAAIQKLAARRKTLFPSGIAAAGLLGFTTQTARRGELATSALSLPRKLIGRETIVHARRPEAWSKLSEIDAALLDFLRRGGRTSELTPRETIRKTRALLMERNRYRRLIAVADTEPPRVRAILGALGEQVGRPAGELNRLRMSLNSLSRFDFGIFADMENARDWQAKERR
jgi:hypothetical protein